MRESLTPELELTSPELTSNIILQLTKRTLSGGGFRDHQGGAYRADATAWAVLTLMTIRGSELLDAGRSRLAADQQRDGSICISPLHPDAFWPTALAILAWQGSRNHRQCQARAVQFLLHTTGRHWVKRADDPGIHDTALKGWPWIGETHSWVEPTALSMLALRTLGYGQHARMKEAIQMLMDRQLPHGGWNVGSTIVFGKEQRSAPESTGTALHALTGLIPREGVQRSLDYLNTEVASLHTPIALGWSLLALNSWGVTPPNARTLIAECLKKQEKFGPYDTTSLCLLVLPLLNPKGLLSSEKTA
jgi:hypothetical protein